jgi:hypothetical protein
MLNYQKTYNTVRDHLLSQRKKSMLGNSDYVCAYRGKDGLKCAVGILIKDKFFDPKCNADDLSLPGVKAMICKSLKLKDLTAEDLDFLSDLQLIHDCCNIDEWEEQLHDFADCNSLKR